MQLLRTLHNKLKGSVSIVQGKYLIILRLGIAVLLLRNKSVLSFGKEIIRKHKS